MQETDIRKGTRLIAEFMGLKWKSFNGKCDIFLVPEAEQLNYRAITIGGYNLLYHSSWDALMPIVEKISRLPLKDAKRNWETFYPITFGMIADNGQIMVRFNRNPVFMADTLIEATWVAVVDFIQLHNAKK